jgi:hypothetical protein
MTKTVKAFCLTAFFVTQMAQAVPAYSQENARKGTDWVRVQPVAHSPVQTLSLDGTWLFRPDEVALSPTELDAEAVRIALVSNTQQDWYPLAVPQFLNRYAWWLDISQKFVQADRARLAALPFDAEKTDAGWYLRQIELPSVTGAIPEVVVNFEGVAMMSRVYCNGHYVGGHVGMFGAFECRLTPYLKWGEVNTLQVYAERGADVQGAEEVIGVAVTVPVTRGMLAALNHGMFGGFGRGAYAKFLGIWQPVTLKISQSGVRIADVFFQPSVDGHKIDLTLDNPGNQAAEGRVFYQVRDKKSGAVLCEEAQGLPVKLDGGTRQVLNLEKDALSPKLWSPDFPHLYDLTIELKSADGKQTVDRWTHAVGYRTVSVKGTQLYLNGHPYWTRGAGMPVYGYKPNNEETASGFLRRMHEGNQMVTRSGCNPWNALWFGVADEEGVGVICEGVRPWALMSKQAPPEAAILAQWKAEQLETVRQYRNHPSILFYCGSNEGMQGDHHNEEKLAIFKDIMNAMREVDPTRPICQTSGEPDYGGNADIEDVHSYWGWYEPSSFVFDYTIPRRGLQTDGKRPFINKETGVPYQDTDTGAVHPSYVRYYSAHPWVGEIGIHGGDPSYFGEHVRAEAKLKTEKLRRQRKELPTAGMILFANTTWIGDVLTASPDQWRPFPVWEGVHHALAPVLVGWTTVRQVFFANETFRSRAFVVNDDAGFRDLKNLKLRTEVLDASGKTLSTSDQPLGDVNYFDGQEWPMEIEIPAPAGSDQAMVPATVKMTLSDDAGVVSTNLYPIRIAARSWACAGGRGLVVAVEGCSSEILAHLHAMGARVLTLAEAEAEQVQCDVVVLGPQASAIEEEAACAVLKHGGRLVALQQGVAAQRLCADIFPMPAPAWGDPTGCELLPQGFREGARWSTDRDITFTQIPARLEGATQILMRMDDKLSNPDQPFIRFNLSVGGTVLVAFDSRAVTLPAWLKEWRKTGEMLQTNTGFRLNLFEKDFSEGEVVLGGNKVPGATAMYAVVVLPVDDGEVTRLQLMRPGQSGDDVSEFKTHSVSGEFVEMLGWDEGSPLFSGLDAMDWKWWARGEGQPAFAATSAHRIDMTGKNVLPLGRYLTPHFYWSGDVNKVYESKLTYPVFAVRRPWGELVVCDLAVADSVAFDPRAARTLSNLLVKKIYADGGSVE